MKNEKTIQLLKEIRALLKELDRFKDNPLLYKCKLNDLLEVFEIEKLILKIETELNEFGHVF